MTGASHVCIADTSSHCDRFASYRMKVPKEQVLVSELTSEQNVSPTHEQINYTLGI